jgi:hypothetical protein
MPQRTWTIEEIRELGLVTNVETAGSILGLSRTQAYAAIQRNEFPGSGLPGRRAPHPCTGSADLEAARNRSR